MTRDAHRILVSVVALGGLCCATISCATVRQSAVAPIAPNVLVPTRIDALNYDEARRSFYMLKIHDARRAPLRQALLAHLLRVHTKAATSSSYEANVTLFEEAMSYYQPVELAADKWSVPLQAVAEGLLEQASARGDEARMLAALTALEHVVPERAAHYRDSYQEVAGWGREVRKNLESPVESWTRLIEVWQEHARLTPVPSILSYLVDLYVQRRDAALVWIDETEGGAANPTAMWSLEAAPLGPMVARTPLDVAGIYLQYGDLATARGHVLAMGTRSGTERRVLEVLRSAEQLGPSGAEALYELAEVYRASRPEVATGMCHLGMQRFAKEASFPLCLARLAAQKESYSDMASYYNWAIALDPQQRRLYDEAEVRLAAVIEQGLFQTNVEAVRNLVASSERILTERVRRWGSSDMPVSLAQLHLLAGVLEMNAGDSAAAERHLRLSLKLEKTHTVLVQLGVLAERTGKLSRAISWYRRALRRLPMAEANHAKRAETLEHLGDTWRKDGAHDKSAQAYGEALSLWDKAVSSVSGGTLAILHVRRGVLYDRLDLHDQAVTAFRDAMSAEPSWRETYASILAHLVVAKPDVPLAHEVFRQAQRQLSLEPEWKVYFALWVTSIAGRAGTSPDRDVDAVLQELSDTASWWSQLAKFGSGQLPYDKLIVEANGPGQQTEAYFYEAARRLTRGDASGARQLFQRVLDSRMVSFYEFAMAQELIATVGP